MANVDIAPFITWDTFIRDYFDWRQGQHVTLIGPNGSGKTVVNRHLLRYRHRRHGYCCVFATKPSDDELEDLEKRTHYLRVKDNNNWSSSSYPRLLIWPPAGEFNNLAHQRRIFLKCLQGMWKKGRWTACLNELRYLTEHLKLKQEINTLYLQARAAKFSLTAETQRPRHVPLEAFSQSSHVFFFWCRDDEDLKRISGIGNADPKEIRATVAALKEFESCYVNARSGEIYRTKAIPFAKKAA